MFVAQNGPSARNVKQSNTGLTSMSETRPVFDPFLGEVALISNWLTDRLRGRYATGPTLPNGEPEFGWREFPAPPIQLEAANEIDRLRRGLSVALNMLEPNEPPDSRAVSDEFVALYALSIGDSSDKVMAVIDAALQHKQAHTGR